MNGSIFGSNLELNKAQGAGGPGRGEAGASPPLDPAERDVYFRIEAGRIVAILREELGRKSAASFSANLVKDLYNSWIALWENETEQRIRLFTGMFRTARDVFARASELDGWLTGRRRRNLARLVEAMSELLSGRGDRGRILEDCSALSNVCRAMLSAGGEKSQEPREAHRGEHLPDKPEDISRSVDEWFTQVSRLVSDRDEKKPGDAGGKEPAAEDAGPPEQEKEAEPVAASSENTPASGTPPDESPAEQGAEDTTGREETPDEKAPLGEPAAETVAEPGAGEAASEPEEEQPEPAAGPASEEPGPGTADAPDDNEIVEPCRTDEDTVRMAELYLAQHCRDTIELVRHNLPRLASGRCGRTERMLASSIEDVRSLSGDFGLHSLDECFDSLLLTLDELREDRAGALEAERALEEFESRVGRVENAV